MYGVTLNTVQFCVTSWSDLFTGNGKGKQFTVTKFSDANKKVLKHNYSWVSSAVTFTRSNHMKCFTE